MLISCCFLLRERCSLRPRREGQFVHLLKCGSFGDAVLIFSRNMTASTFALVPDRSQVYAFDFPGFPTKCQPWPPRLIVTSMNLPQGTKTPSKSPPQIKSRREYSATQRDTF